MNPLRLPAGTLALAGHRGHSAGAPENTLAAFRAARDLGGEGVTCETDLRMTRDGELVLIHDETVDRTTDGRGLVAGMDYAAVAGLDAGGWFGAAFAAERVPRLAEALHLARAIGIRLQVEIKPYDRDDAIFPRLRSLIDTLACADLMQFSSFDFAQLRALKAAIPEVPTVGLMHSRLIDPAAIARQAHLDAMNIEIQHFPRGEARQLHDAGIAAFLHVPRPDRLQPLKAYGLDIEAAVVGWIGEGLLDQIISDDVAHVARLRDWAFARQG
jgi:glycerophosphoryl diester phosphodiesterase